MSHHTAPIAIRERVAVTPERLPATLESLHAVKGIHEAVILSTCNRTEIYAHCSDNGQESLRQWVAQRFQLDDRTVDRHAYVLADGDAARHLVSVAAGLDSLVLGEPQILGQVKQAWRDAGLAGTTGPILERLFQRTFEASKTIRTETDIGRNPVSVASTAVSLAKQIFGDLTSRCVLLIGAGDMIRLCLTHLQSEGIQKLLIANRDASRAAQLAGEHAAESLALEALGQRLHEADIIITSTGASQPILLTAQLREALKQRRQRPMFVVDIAVPRDVEPSAQELDDLYLYSIDDLQQVIDANLSDRNQALHQASHLADLHSNAFMRWWRGRRASRQLGQMRRQARNSAEELVERALRELEQGGLPREVLQRMAEQLTNRILHQPSLRLREAAEEDRQDIVQAADHLFRADPTSGKDPVHDNELEPDQAADHRQAGKPGR